MKLLTWSFMQENFEHTKVICWFAGKSWSQHKFSVRLFLSLLLKLIPHSDPFHILQNTQTETTATTNNGKPNLIRNWRLRQPLIGWGKSGSAWNSYGCKSIRSLRIKRQSLTAIRYKFPVASVAVFSFFLIALAFFGEMCDWIPHSKFKRFGAIQPQK